MAYKFDYTPVAGEAYTRCSQVVIDNKLGKAPSVTFQRERIIGMDNGSPLHQPLSPRITAFDPAKVLTIINPETGEETGETITQAELYAIIYSAFIAAETETNDTEAVQ